jgi:hypothetical protein
LVPELDGPIYKGSLAISELDRGGLRTALTSICCIIVGCFLPLIYDPEDRGQIASEMPVKFWATTRGDIPVDSVPLGHQSNRLLYFVCGIFYGAFSTSDYIALNATMTSD